jgi:thiol-disulfide isomerase/thioredoxin
VDHDRRRLLGRAASTLVAMRLGVIGSALDQIGCAERPVRADAELASLASATAWINSRPLTADALRGKVVLIDFWTYTCINWLRTLSHVRAWSEKYRDRGLVTIGVHAPEFSFEHDLDNVRRETAAMRVAYPVAVDNERAIWNAFHNEYWPALYLIDAQGRSRFHHFGEGEYEQSERTIQQLLAEAGASGVGRALVSVDGQGLEMEADWGSLRSPELYLNSERTTGFASPGGVVPDERHVYTLPPQLTLNQWALSGDWTIGREPTTLNAAGGRLVTRFHARDAHLVMGPATKGATVRFRVLLDDGPPGGAHGGDIDGDGNGMVTEQRLYQLIRQSGKIGDRQLTIEFLDPRVQAFAFTFG